MLHAGRLPSLSRHIVYQAGQDSCEQSDISLLAPHLQLQWDHTANAHLGHITIRPYSNKRVWWMCDQCPDRHPHRWQATVTTRSRGTGCPQCAGKKVCQHNSLATKAPDVARLWNYSKNSLTPDTVVAHSSIGIEWKCDVCGHEWTVSPNSRVTSNHGCARCNAGGRPLADGTKPRNKHPTFAESKHPLLAEWDHNRNEAQGILPSTTSLSSRKKVYWLCQQCPAGRVHSWCVSPNRRLNKNQRVKRGCPMCAGKLPCKCNSLQALYPAVAAQWDHTKNVDTPDDYTAASGYHAWWVSSERGSWQQTIESRTCAMRRAIASAAVREQA